MMVVMKLRLTQALTPAESIPIDRVLITHGARRLQWIQWFGVGTPFEPPPMYASLTHHTAAVGWRPFFLRRFTRARL